MIVSGNDDALLRKHIGFLDLKKKKNWSMNIICSLFYKEF